MLSEKPKNFGVTLNDFDILTYSMSNTLGIDIKAKSPIKVIGCIEPFIEENVRLDFGYTIQEWNELNRYDKAKEVALHTINKMIEYKINEKQQKKISKGR